MLNTTGSVIDFEFEKYHGLGNDFIFISLDILNKFSNVSSLKNFVCQLCTPHLSVGADGVIFYQFNSQNNKVEMLIVNSDGSFAGNCGNALRCLGLALFRKKYWSGINQILFVFRPVLPSYIMTTLQDSEKYLLYPKPFGVLQNISANCLQQKAVVSTFFDLPKFLGNWQNIENSLCEISQPPIKVQLENPHLVFLSHDFKNFLKKDFCLFGKKIQQIENANIGMITLPPKSINKFELCVYERGAGYTSACGTGAVASALALEFLGQVESLKNKVELIMPGGSLMIQKCDFDDSQYADSLDLKSKEVIALSAEAEFVFSARMRVASA